MTRTPPADLLTSDARSGVRLHRRRHVIRWWRRPVGLIIAAWLTWPIISLTPGAGLDPGYGYALAEAIRDGAQFGRGLVFTYGPLGFLTAPTLWWAPATAGALLAVGLVHVAWCAAVWVAARRHLPRIAAAAVLVVTMWLSTMTPATETGDAGELLALTLALAALLLIEGPPSAAWTRVALAAGPVFAGFALLVKFDTGLLAVVVVTVAGAALADRWWTGAAVGVGGTAAAATVLWTAAGQSVSGLWPFLHQSIVMSLGWGDALRYEAPGTAWQYPVAALLAVAICGLLATGDLRRRPAAWLIVMGVLAVGFKHGFVRHDAHAVEYFLTAAVLVLGTGRGFGVRHGAWVASLSAAMTSLFVVGAPVRPAVMQWAQGAGRLVGQVEDVASTSHRLGVQLSGRNAIRAAYPVPSPVLALLHRDGVQVEPWQTSIAWAYGLRWQPTPVFQTNMIDEHSLDELMAKSLARPGAPGAILRARISDLGVPEAWDGPAYRLAELCRYREAYSDSAWEVLTRATNRCGKARLLSSAALLPGQPLAVPLAPLGHVVTASIRLPAPALTIRLHDLAYKPSTSLRLSAGGVTGTVYRGTAVGPLVMSVPRGAEPGGDWPDGRALTLKGFSGRAEITFWAVPLNS